MQQGLISLQNFDARFRMQAQTNPAKSIESVYADTGVEDSKESPVIQVRSGDTLSEIVRDFLKEQGGSLTLKDIYQGVQAVAQANGLVDPDRIYAGQNLNLSALTSKPSRPVPPAARASQIPENSAFVLPVQGRVTSRFGLREHPIDHELQFHNGVDIAAKEGTPIRAAKDGRVVFSGWKNGYGQVVELDHGNGYRTLYAHTSVNRVSYGETVSQGEEIALVGSTGRVTGPHVHFEISRRGKRMDPLATAGAFPNLTQMSSPLLAKAE